jgi:hypothetical protein
MLSVIGLVKVFSINWTAAATAPSIAAALLAVVTLESYVILIERPWPMLTFVPPLPSELSLNESPARFWDGSSCRL